MGKLIGGTKKAGKTVVRKELRYFLNLFFIFGVISGFLLTASLSINYLWPTLLLIPIGLWMNHELKKTVPH